MSPTWNGFTAAADWVVTDFWDVALRYRKEQNLPCETIIVKRGEKERIKNEHIVSLARVAYQLKMRAFMQAKDGTISELLAQAKEDDTSKTPPAPPPHDHQAPPGGH